MSKDKFLLFIDSGGAICRKRFSSIEFYRRTENELIIDNTILVSHEARRVFEILEKRFGKTED